MTSHKNGPQQSLSLVVSSCYSLSCLKVAPEAILGSFWGHLGSSWGHLGAVLGLSRGSTGAIFERRQRGFGTFIFQGLRCTLKAPLVSVFCHSPFLCDVIEDLATRGAVLWPFSGSKLASRWPQGHPNLTQHGRRRPQDGRKRPQDGRKMPQDGP